MKVVGVSREPDNPTGVIMKVDIGDGGEPVDVGVHIEGSTVIDEYGL